ncbi:MAG: uroporphyrinogen-III synthase [Alphaproteobacteria bacterium]|nr:MAG: uroporphyrinogen-III synthase [Alphaproteobacteria bacterium]
MRLLVTRPEKESAALAAVLMERGHEVLIEPILEIVFDEAQEVPLEGVQALLFTSANGVEAFARVSDNRALPVFAVGKVTAKAARAAGFVIVSVSGGDVDLLAADVAAALGPRNGALLHVAGSHVAGDLKGYLEKRGFEVRRSVLYEARERDAFSEETAKALESGALDGVLLYSWRSANGFAELIRNLGVPLDHVTCYCLSKNVAKALEGLNFKEILVAERPEQDLLLKLLPETSH